MPQWDNKQNGKLVNLIWRNCSDIVSVYKNANQVLYRGVNGTPGKIFKGDPVENRKPMSSSSLLQQVYDAYLEKKGIAARRSNSIFCTADKQQAEMYGTLYIIFPINGFNYHWSQKHDDIILDSSAAEDILNPKVVKAIALDVRDHKLLNKPIPAFWKKYPADEDPYYILARQDWKTLIYDLASAGIPEAQRLNLNNLGNPGAIESLYAPTDKGIEKCMQLGHEILIQGSYYAVAATESRALLQGLGIWPKRSANLWAGEEPL